MAGDTFPDDEAGAPPGGIMPLQRMASGIAGLDDVLLGGFIVNGIYVVQGRPGSGKTIFANQLCFNHVRGGGRALYVTLLSEQHERLLANIAQLSFYEPGAIARELNYVSALQTLEQEGLAGLLTLIRREMMRHAASILVVDGLVAVEAMANSELELKRFVHDLQMLSAAGECTMFLLTSARQALVSPEHTMVDGMIELGSSDFGWRVERELLVRKFRGSDYLAGRHAMRITADGIVIYPRIEAQFAQPSATARGHAEKRVTTGIAGLDDMLCGGVPASSLTLLLGPTGSGKTVAGLQFLSQCSAEEPGLLLGFYETPDAVLLRARELAPALPALVESGAVEILWQAPSEDLIDRVASDLIANIRRRGVRRLVIDGILGFSDMAVSPERLQGFFRALSNELRATGVTVISTMEVPELVGPVLQAPISRLTPVAENLILLRYVERDARLTRMMSVMKLRNSPFDTRLREFEIASGGIVVGGGFEGERSVLTGFPSPKNAAGAAEPGSNDQGA